MTGINRKDCALLETPFTVTTTSSNPTGAFGTDATIFVLVHEVGVVRTPANVTVSPVAELPKFVPLIVTELPIGLTGPTVGERLVIVGV
jgi:hypothetical protein